MQWHAGDPFLGSQQVCDAHQVVIDDMCEMIGGQSIGFEYDGVVKVGIFKADISMKFIVDSCLAFQRHGKTYHPCQTGSVICCTLLFAEIAATPIVTWGQFVCDRRSRYLSEEERAANDAAGLT